MKVVDTPTLKRLLQNARNYRYNQLLPPEVESKLDPKGRHVLSKPILHNDDHIRSLCVILKLKTEKNGHETILDFNLKDWNDLPEHGDQN